MGAAIVHSVYRAVVEEERKRVPGNPDGHLTGGAHIVQPSGPYEVSCVCIQLSKPLFRLSDLTLGHDPRGVQITSLVFVSAIGPDRGR